jgi:quercetin dioxygenase-like cupin family protein
VSRGPGAADSFSEVRLVRWEPEDGPLTEKRLMAAMEREGFEVVSYAYRQGTVFPPHAHGQEKCDAVLEGFLRITVGETSYDLKAGDRLYLPAGTRHSAEVIGRRTVLSLDGTRW